MQTDKTAPALAEFFKELEGIRRPVSEDELSRARRLPRAALSRGFETTGQLVGRLEAKVVYGLPDDYFTTYMDRIAKVSAAGRQPRRREVPDPPSAVVIVVGDRKKIEPGIRALNLGPVRVFTVDEILGKAAAAGPGGKSK